MILYFTGTGRGGWKLGWLCTSQRGVCKKIGGWGVGRENRGGGGIGTVLQSVRGMSGHWDGSILHVTGREG